mgnify:CR=1 FL=1
MRNLVIDRHNQVWAREITYVPMARGFVYLVTVIDWYFRCVLSWRLSNTMNKNFCVEALEKAVDIRGALEIFNTDQAANLAATF